MGGNLGANLLRIMEGELNSLEIHPLPVVFGQISPAVHSALRRHIFKKYEFIFLILKGFDFRRPTKN